VKNFIYKISYEFFSCNVPLSLIAARVTQAFRNFQGKLRQLFFKLRNFY